MHQSFSDVCEMGHLLVDKGIDPAFGQFIVDTFCNPGITSAEAHRVTTKYVIAFLKTNLAGATGYQDILTPGYALTREPLAEFFVTEKRSPNSIDADWPDDFVYFPHQRGSAQAHAAKDGARFAAHRVVPTH
jgi:hypothetical protein